MNYSRPQDFQPAMSEARVDIGSPQELAEIMGGTWTIEPEGPLTSIRHRLDTIESGLNGFLFVPELFSKLNGTTGRASLLRSAEAIARGAAGLVVSARPRNLEPGFPCLIVSNPSAAIERLAKHRRAESEARFFAVAGSVGKSTTKNMIHWMANVAGPAHCTIANYNDGLASIYFTLAGMSDVHRFCAAEFSEVGGLEEQARFYRPHISVITNIHHEHIDRMERQGYSGEMMLPRLAEICAGIVRYLQPGGICILNADEENFAILANEVRKSAHVKLRTCGSGQGNDVKILEIQGSSAGSNITIEADGRTYSYFLSLPGRHMAINSVVAATAIHCAGMDLAPALKSLNSFRAGKRRGTVHRVPWKGGFVTFRDESVSSSWPSLRSSLAQMESECPEGDGRRVAVLGQINDMGAKTPEIMAQLAKEAEAGSISRFYTIGSDVRIINECIADRRRVAPHSQTLEKLELRLRDELVPGDVVMFKGTRRPEHIALRRLVERLVAPAEPLAPVTGTGTGTGTGVRARLVVAGDTYFGESYQEKRGKNLEINYLETFGYDYSGKRLSPLFQRADFAVANLECALTTLQQSELNGRKGFILGGKPSETIQALRNLNIGGVLLGNNHAMDYLAAGLEETLSNLAGAQIQATGGGKGRMDAQRPLLRAFDIDGIAFKVAIISGYEFNSNHEDMGFYAGDSSLGVNNINMRRLREQISALKADGFFVIVSPHWGANYCFRTFEQARMADRIIDCGADLILGHGPHMMNEIAEQSGVWVVYSLGNLIFNSEGEYLQRQLPPYSLIAELEFGRKGAGVVAVMNLYPIVSCNQITQFQPTFVDEDQFAQVKNLLVSGKYSPEEFLEKAEFRNVDGRNCITVKLF